MVPRVRVELTTHGFSVPVVAGLSVLVGSIAAFLLGGSPMLLPQPDREGKPQRACTPQSHAAISKSEALFRTLTIPVGYQDCRSPGDADRPKDSDQVADVLELGTCRNCGSTIARELTHFEIVLRDLGLGGVA